MTLSEKELAELDSNAKLLVERISKIRSALILEDDPTRQLRYEKQIAQADIELQEIKGKLAAAYNIHTSNTQSVIYKKIEALQLDFTTELGTYQLVNCNREKMKDRFWDAFDGKETESFQFYFISACPTQMPPSFAERMIYELLIDEYDEVEDAIFRLRRTDTDRIRIVDLPVGRNLANCQKRFKKYFAETFNFRPEESFENFLTTGVPRMKYDAVTLVFKIEETKWKDYILAYFEWLMNAFTETHEEVPTFLFFFVCYKRQLHLLTDKPSVILELDQLASQYAKASHLSPLHPVLERDLKDWLRGLGETNESKVEEVIEMMVKGLKESDKQQYAAKKLLNMDDIERLQEIIYEIGNK